MDSQTAIFEIPVPVFIITFFRTLATAVRTLNIHTPPLTKYFVAALLFSYFIKHAINLIMHAFFDTPPHRLPIAIAFLLLITAGYLHLRITVEDEVALRSSEEAAENEERHGHAAKADFKERIGGLDRDIWQGRPELRKRGRGEGSTNLQG